MNKGYGRGFYHLYELMQVWDFLVAGILPMRSVAFSLIAIMLIPACATVSMVPGQAVVETSATAEQTSLRNICNAYVKQAKAEHWVTPSTGILGLAKVLIDGASDKDNTRKNYADIIEAETADVTVLHARFLTDIGAARVGLDAVNAEAISFMVTSTETKASLRKDVVSFEGALVAAQKSRRNFAKATSVVAKRSDVSLVEIDASLAAFDTTIDSARDIANQLANAHASIASETAIS